MHFTNVNWLATSNQTWYEQRGGDVEVQAEREPAVGPRHAGHLEELEEGPRALLPAPRGLVHDGVVTAQGQGAAPSLVALGRPGVQLAGPSLHVGLVKLLQREARERSTEVWRSEVRDRPKRLEM